jgi:hypothetical protein
MEMPRHASTNRIPDIRALTTPSWPHHDSQCMCHRVTSDPLNQVYKLLESLAGGNIVTPGSGHRDTVDLATLKKRASIFAVRHMPRQLIAGSEA